MKRLDDFRMQMGRHELVPIMVGGMGVDISSSDLALEAARLGGVGHISDAMIKTVTDRRYKTKYVKAKQAMYKLNVESADKSTVKFDLGLRDRDERGPIPPNHVVRARNGDSHDTRIENLELLSRAENQRRNSTATQKNIKKAAPV